jgi:hypothetical protein
MFLCPICVPQQYFKPLAMASLNFQAQLKRGELFIRIIYQTTTKDRKFLNTGFKLPSA